ncbi:phosphatase PAP2 family protein [Arthrobacter sp. Soc17.1.1.1]|uniref:phosphatase PAP2 family protein n=1 Tax=Arthrobacter sp. Soc17.1.1.1 TaxID=3121277 RepID=UPI002FE4D7A3
MSTQTISDEVRTSPVGRIARTATEIAQPPLVLSVLLVLASILQNPVLPFVMTGIIAALTICLVPFAVVVVMARRGRLTDHHVGDKRQRRGVMLWTLGSALVGAGLLTLMDTPRPLWGLIGGIFAGIVTLIVISPVWKVSGHAMTLGGATVTSLLMFGWAGLPVLIAAPLVCWSRVYLKDHSAAQVIVGFLVGAVAFGISYTLIAA